MQNQPLIGVVIVTWNNSNDIKECLDSIQQQDYKNIKVLVVDNASSDNTVDIVKKEFPAIEIVARDKNYFLTPSNNFGIKLMINKYNPEYLLILNPDTKSSPNLVSTLLKSLKQDPAAFAAGPKVLFYKNANEGLINSAGLVFDGFMQAYDRGFEQQDKGQFNKTEYVFGVTGACILYKAKVLKELGFYWEKIKLYMDEVELFIRANKKGYKVIFNPETVLFHKWMKSSDQQKLVTIQKVKNQAWLWIALRHYSLKSKIAMILNYIAAR